MSVSQQLIHSLSQIKELIHTVAEKQATCNSLEQVKSGHLSNCSLIDIKSMFFGGLFLLCEDNAIVICEV